MGKILDPVVAALLLPASADANANHIQGSLPCLSVLVAVLLEVLVVALIMWRFRFNILRLTVIWLGVNFFFHFLLPRCFGVLLDDFEPLHTYMIAGVFMAIAAEAAALYWLGKFPYLRRICPKPLPLSWAMIASLAGNLTSLLSFIGLAHLANSLVVLR